jgi:RNA polymerase sigma-70 factor (ECF subfamily)
VVRCNNEVVAIVCKEVTSVELIRDDRAEIFRVLAREQLPRLYSIGRRLVGDDAEDAVQDCLLKAFQRFDQLTDMAAGPAWLT